jgi:hypothetical protein
VARNSHVTGICARFRAFPSTSLGSGAWDCKWCGMPRVQRNFATKSQVDLQRALARVASASVDDVKRVGHQYHVERLLLALRGHLPAPEGLNALEYGQPWLGRGSLAGWGESLTLDVVLEALQGERPRAAFRPTTSTATHGAILAEPHWHLKRAIHGSASHRFGSASHECLDTRRKCETFRGSERFGAKAPTRRTRRHGTETSAVRLRSFAAVHSCSGQRALTRFEIFAFESCKFDGVHKRQTRRNHVAGRLRWR